MIRKLNRPQMLSNDEIRIIEELGGHITSEEGEEFRFFPYIYRKLFNGLYERVHFDKLPIEVQRDIAEMIKIKYE